MSQNKISTKICGLDFCHPLLCPPILVQIFNVLELKDLENFRLVCQDWNAISLLQMKNRKVKISLTYEDSFNGFLNNETGFSEFQRFKFTYSIESEPNLVKFMNMLRKIQLKDVIFVIGKNDDVNLNLIDKFLSFLAEHSRNFESFGIEILEESSRVPPAMDFESFPINWTQLKSLGIWYVTDYPFFLPILEKASKLESLVIIEGPPYSAYRPSLENLIHTLTQLVLYEWFAHPERNWTFLPGVNNNVDILPAFSKLKCLSITRDSDRCFDMTIPSLPELTTLSLQFNSCVCPRFKDLTIFPKLKSLVWECGISMEEKDFKKFPNMFPNLKSFQTSKYRSSTVWKYLRGIEELCINRLYMEDKGIIGFDLDLSAAPDTDNESSQDDPNQEYSDWSVIYKRDKCHKEIYNLQYGQSTGIQALSELKRLTIAVDKISNASIIFGLLKCKSLRSVRLVNPSSFLTKEILLWMADELNLMNLSIEVFHRDWLTSNEANYFRQKHPNCQLVFQYFPTQFAYISHQRKQILLSK